MKLEEIFNQCLHYKDKFIRKSASLTSHHFFEGGSYD